MSLISNTPRVRQGAAVLLIFALQWLALRPRHAMVSLGKTRIGERVSLRIACMLLLGLSLFGCASDLPRDIASPPPHGNPPLAAVRADPGRFSGTPVRWGGTIAAVENRKNDTWIDVVGRQLERDGRPIVGDRSEGRFMAKLHGFVDPAVYAKGRELTVAGTIAGELTKRIGQFPYRFVVVDVHTLHLWQPLPKYPREPPPFWYDDPWAPFGFPYGYPYGYPYGPMFGPPY